MTETTLYDDDFMLSRFIQSVNREVYKFSPVIPVVQKKDRKTFVFNFEAVCKYLKRDTLHIKTYLEKELQVESSINQAGALIITGMYDPKRIKNIIEQYVTTFVLCKEGKCRSGLTEIIKEDRNTYLICSVCKSKYFLNLKLT
jgi:translation initiation factor 2 beta subunit (eIF-2beta)/eIF-5